MSPRWYMVNTIGMATLCRGELDAKQVASAADIVYPQHAPHRAVQLVEASTLENLRASIDAWHQSRKLQGEARVLRRLLAEARDVLGTIADEGAEDGGEQLAGLLRQIDAALDPTSRDCQQLCIAAEPPTGDTTEGGAR